VWNAEHTILYDMQFTPQAIIRTLDNDLPKPYGASYAHPDITVADFSRYREFYAPGQISAALRLDSAHTLYRPGDTVKISATLRNPPDEAWRGVSLQARITDQAGREVYSGTLLSGLNLTSSAAQKVAADAWSIPSTQAPGTYPVELRLAASDGKVLARTTTEVAVNALPASLLVVCPHEDDEQAYAGLIRAAIEAKVPVQVLILTAGDISQCARYFTRACGPNEAREFGSVRMEESAQALEHLGLTRDKLSVLGLPDGGLAPIWSDYKDSTHSYLSIFLACDHAPFGNAYKPNLSYSRDAVIAAVRQVLTDFHPATIVVTHPDERHVDHRAANWFVIKACQDLLKTKEIDPQTVVLAAPAIGGGGLKPAPYKYESVVVHLSGEAAALKQETAWFYQTQNGNQSEAARKTLAELPREEKYLRITDWQEHEGWNEDGGK
jgi:LmbE family N-acetylglucosaminyl deacetylase